MAVRRYQTELAHAPRLLPKRFANLRAGGADRLVKGVDIFYLQVGKVGVISELGRRQRRRTLARHDGTGAQAVKEPAGIGNRMDLEAENVPVESRRFLQIVNGDDKAMSEDFRH